MIQLNVETVWDRPLHMFCSIMLHPFLSKARDFAGPSLYSTIAYASGRSPLDNVLPRGACINFPRGRDSSWLVEFTCFFVFLCTISINFSSRICLKLFQITWCNWQREMAQAYLVLPRPWDISRVRSTTCHDWRSGCPFVVSLGVI